MLDEILKEELVHIERQGLLRTLRTISSPAGAEIKSDGKTAINFASNDYLGLAGDPQVVQAARDALESHGMGASASRLIAGNTDLHELLEKNIASFKNKDAALVFPTGYMANIGCITSLISSPDDLIIADRLIHASLFDACRNAQGQLRVFAHNDVDALERILAKYNGKKRRIMVVTEGVFSMDGDCAPLDRISAVADRYNALVMVDDAHGTGVLGDNGRGTAELFGVEDRIDIHMGTLSKACGVLGGFVAGSHTLRTYLINKARSFIYTTGIPPVLCAAACAALRIIQDEPERRQRLHDIGAMVRSELRDIGLSVPDGCTPIIPVIVGDARKVMRISQKLSDDNILVPGIRYPTVAHGQERLRISLQATHTDEHIDRLLRSMRAVTE